MLNQTATLADFLAETLDTAVMAHCVQHGIDNVWVFEVDPGHIAQAIIDADPFQSPDDENGWQRSLDAAAFCPSTLLIGEEYL